MMKKPILFLIFNSPERTLTVFEEIRNYQPTQFFISADGPRNESEAPICTDLRQTLLSKIDWPCEVFTNFAEKNLGCALAVSSGITWFFEQAEEGIILEDDCKPLPSFFDFCEQMLDFHRNDNEVMHISGSNLNTQIVDNRPYLFAYPPAIWGWATWRRAWAKYNLYLNFSLQEFELCYVMQYMPASLREHGIYRYKFAKKYPTYTWDYQWVLTIVFYKGLSIYPTTNLVENIGFNESATNTFSPPKIYKNVSTNAISSTLTRRVPELDDDFMQTLIANNVEMSIINKVKKQIWLFSPNLMKRLIKLKLSMTDFL